MAKPIAIDLFCGLGGWTEGLLAEGYEVFGYDIEAHEYGNEKYPATLILQDVLTLHGSQFKDAALIVASPPCQFFSYTAMPWSKAKALAAEVRADPAKLAERLELFNACFRIQREASEAAGRHIPLVVENVRGAIPWVGRSRWNYGSFHLWGDVPALMPPSARSAMKAGVCHRSDGATNFHGFKNKTGGSWFGLNPHGTPGGRKVPSLAGGRRTDIGKGARFTSRDCGEEGTKLGGSWFHGYRQGQGPRNHGSKSKARKAASARIAKIPLTLSRWIAAHYLPRESLAA